MCPFSSLYSLTLPIWYRFLANFPKMHNLLTLVDQFDFICKRKSKSISVTKKVKKKNIDSGLERNGRRRERTFLSIKTLSDTIILTFSLCAPMIALTVTFSYMNFEPLKLRVEGQYPYVPL